MAGSINHIVDPETGEFTMELIENLGDAHEALEECYMFIYTVSNGEKELINPILEGLGFPEIQHNLVLVFDKFSSR